MSVDGNPARAHRNARIVITTTATLNGGDAALLEAQLAIVRAAVPGAVVTTFDQQGGDAATYRPWLGLRPSLVWPRGGAASRSRLRWTLRLLRLLSAAMMVRVGARSLATALAPSGEDLDDLDLYAHADLVLTNPGTMLVDHYNYAPRLVDYSIAHILGTPVVHFTQTMGPFSRRWTNPWLRWLLSHARLVMVRGEESKRAAADLGVTGDRVVICPDPVFVLATDEALDHGKGRRLPSKGGRVAISVRDWPFFDGQAEFELAVADLCTTLVEDRGCEITFVSTCQGVPEYWADDSVTADRIVERLHDRTRSRVRVAKGFHTTDELREILTSVDVVVSTRLHLAILALVSGTPAIPINYEPKSREVFERLRAKDLTIDIDSVDNGRLVEHTLHVLDQIDERRSALFDAVQRERTASRDTGDLVTASLGGQRGHAPG